MLPTLSASMNLVKTTFELDMPLKSDVAGCLLSAAFETFVGQGGDSRFRVVNSQLFTQPTFYETPPATCR